MCHVGGEGRLYLGMEAAPVGLGQVGEEDPQGVDPVRQLEQTQLDDEEADLGLVPLVVPQGLVRLQDHLPEEAEEEIVALAGGEVLDDIVLIAHGPPGPPLLLHVLLQLGDVLLGHVGLAQQVHQDGGEVGGGVGGPGVRGVGHDGAHNILQPGSPVLEIKNK